MKYSQALFVAVVGGAALAAAAPTAAPPAAAAVQGEQAPLAPTSHTGKASKHPKVEETNAKVEVTKPVEGANPVEGVKPHHKSKTEHHHQTDATREGQTTGSRRHRQKGTANKAVTHPDESVAEKTTTKPKRVRHRKTKAEKSAEVAKPAEGVKPGAKAAGTSTTTTTEPKVSRDLEEFFERSFDEDSKAVRDLTEGFELYERSNGEELEARIFDGLWRAFTPHKKPAGEHAKHTGHKHTANKEVEHKEGAPSAAVPSTGHAELKTAAHVTSETAAAPSKEVPPVTPEAPTQAPLATRDVMDDDELVARYFDELEARGLWSRVKGIFHKSAPAAAPVDPSMEQRDFDEDDLLARFEEEIEARGLWSKVKSIFHKTPAAPAPAPDATYEGRSFDEDLFERDFDEDLFERDFDDLELRGLWSRVKGIFHKTPAAPAPAPDATYEGRSFDEDLFERDLYDEEDLFERDFYDEEDLMARGQPDVLDALEAVKKTFTPKQAREFFEELAARSFADWELEELD